MDRYNNIYREMSVIFPGMIYTVHNHCQGH